MTPEQGVRDTLTTIAIDGPAASGKGTLARRLADRFGLNYLDTGLTYRAVAAAMIAGGNSLDDAQAAVAAARKVDLATLDREVLSAHGVGEAASRVAVMPQVRAVLVERQREFAMRPPGAVLDGRDIGTVVAPDALVKLFVTAEIDERARRRLLEIQARGGAGTHESVHADLARRDGRDAGRAVAPLAKADDAHLLDTTGMDIETAFRKAVDIINQAKAERIRGARP
ncbi:MAG: (d)CMP kinase [Alphaproteobacteria bacterium]